MLLCSQDLKNVDGGNGIKAKDSPFGQIQHLHWEEGRCLLAGLLLKNQVRENISEVKEKMETAQVNLEMFE